MLEQEFCIIITGAHCVDSKQCPFTIIDIVGGSPVSARNSITQSAIRINCTSTGTDEFNSGYVFADSYIACYSKSNTCYGHNTSIDDRVSSYTTFCINCSTIDINCFFDIFISGRIIPFFRIDKIGFSNSSIYGTAIDYHITGSTDKIIVAVLSHNVQ